MAKLPNQMCNSEYYISSAGSKHGAEVCHVDVVLYIILGETGRPVTTLLALEPYKSKSCRGLRLSRATLVAWVRTSGSQSRLSR